MIQKRLERVLDKVLSPQGQPTKRMKPLSMARRLNTMEGKTVYLVDGKFGGGYEFLEEMQGWFSRNMPKVNTVLRRKTGNMFMDDPELWAEIKEKGGAMVLGVGG